MGCCSSDPPPPPDYAAAAQQQGQANLETARATASLNRPDIHSWQGSQTWQKDPNQPDHLILTNSLNDAELNKYNTSNEIQNQLLDTLQSSGIKPIQDALNTSYTLPGSYQANAGGPGPNDYYGDVNYGGAPQGQGSLSFAGAPGMPVADEAARKQAQDAAYQNGAQYLDSQYGQQEKSLGAKLANQGIAPGSEAYKQAMQDFNDQKARDYGNLRTSSIGQGNQELQAGFGRGLAGRQQGVAEATAQGQFANSARQQAVQEILNAFTGHNSAVAQASQTGLAQQQGANQARSAALQEMVQSKTLPINVLTALLSGSQVNAPNFQPFNNNIQIGETPIFQGAQEQGKQNIASQNSSNAQSGQAMNLMGTLGSAAMAASLC